MFYLTNFHADYPHAQVIIGKCGDTISLSCQIESENSSTTSVRKEEKKTNEIDSNEIVLDSNDVVSTL